MTHIIRATTRTEAAEKMRAAGQIPAIVYGAGGDTRSLALDYKEFAKLYNEVSESTLLNLEIDGKNANNVLVQDIQLDPVSDKFIHVDLRRIDMDKPIEAKVELHFIGEAPAVKELGGTFVHSISEVEVKCLPKDLMEHLDVDISVLKTFEDNIKIKDLALPKDVVILGHNADDVVATATPALTEEQIKAMEEASKSADVSKIEVAGKKKEDETAAEGEAAAADKKKE